MSKTLKEQFEARFTSAWDHPVLKPLFGFAPSIIRAALRSRNPAPKPLSGLQLEVQQTPQGYGKVAWVQTTSETGETVGKRRTRTYIISGLVGGLVLGISMGDPSMLIGGPIAGLIFAMHARMKDREERSGPNSPDAEPIIVPQYCEAWIERHGDELALNWSLRGQRSTDSFTIPLVDVKELVLGGFNEWFGNKGSAKSYHESFVIVMPLADGGVARLADHAGRQADVAELHSILSQVLIEPRTALLRRLDKELREHSRGTSASDVPDSI
jgi:hypothetical protein